MSGYPCRVRAISSLGPLGGVWGQSKQGGNKNFFLATPLDLQSNQRHPLRLRNFCENFAFESERRFFRPIEKIQDTKLTDVSVMVSSKLIIFMSEPKMETDSFVKNSALYREFLAEREEILKHKWIESEKAGRDVGFEKALLDWIVKHRASWRRHRMQQQLDGSAKQ